MKACDRIRTSDLLITNELHYQLCYTSISHDNNNIISQFFGFVKPLTEIFLTFFIAAY